MKKYKYILLDWDGCLAKTLDNWLSAYKKVFAKEGLHPTTEEVVSKAFSEREQGMVNIGSKDPNVSWSMVVDEVNKNISNVKLYKGAKTVLDALKKQKKKMALHTSSDRKTVIPQLKNHHLLKYFDTILTRDDVVNRKPNPEVLQKALKEIGGTTHQAITVGDSAHEVKCGKNAGIATCIYYPKNNEKFYRREDLEAEKPDYFIEDLKELLGIVGG